MHYFSNVPSKKANMSWLYSTKVFYLQLFILLCWAFSPLVHSKNELKRSEQQHLTLSIAIERTLKDNPSLKVFKFRQNVLEGQLQSQGLSPAYEVGFEMENFAGTGDIGVFDSTEFTLSLSSILELGD